VDFIADIINGLAGYVWGWPEVFPAMIVLLVGTGLFITFRLQWIQLRRLKHAIDITRGKYDDPSHEGDISHFQALSTALSATIGIGNIAGVATAIHYGGPGALFWMWITGILGTSLKYAECTLSMKYRKINPDGSASGGPMYYMEKALGWKWLGIVFATAASICALATGNAIQAFTVANQLNSDFAIPAWMTGLVIASLVGVVIIGGVKRIGRVTAFLSPFMTVVYLLGALCILLLNMDKIPGAFTDIFNMAFTPPGAIGGFAGSGFMYTLIWGIKRAICTMTGLAIIVTGAWTVTVDGEALNGSPMTAYAFQHGLTFLNGYGNYIVTAAVLLFATSTMISWSYYGDRSIQYLFGDKVIVPYRFLFCVMIFVGAILELEVVWTFGDVALGIMAIPNLIALVALSGVLVRITNEYYSKDHIPLR